MSATLTEEHKGTAELCSSIVVMTRLLELQLLVDIVRYGREYDSVGAILDPTSWMNQHPQNQFETEIYAAVLKFKEQLNELARIYGNEEQL